MVKSRGGETQFNLISYPDHSCLFQDRNVHCGLCHRAIPNHTKYCSGRFREIYVFTHNLVDNSCCPYTRGWRDAFFDFRDFASFTLVPRDETEICSIKLSLFNLHGHNKFACTFVMCFGAEWKITTTCTNSIGPSLYYHDQWGWGWMGSAWRNSDYSSGGPAGQPTRPQTNPTLIFIIMVARKSHLCLGGKKRKSSEYPHCTAIHHSLPNDEPLI